MFVAQLGNSSYFYAEHVNKLKHNFVKFHTIMKIGFSHSKELCNEVLLNSFGKLRSEVYLLIHESLMVKLMFSKILILLSFSFTAITMQLSHTLMNNSFVLKLLLFLS